MDHDESRRYQQLDTRGFLYLLSNPAYPEYVKIGHSRTSPFDRARDLFTTGVPEPFKVERAWYVENSYESEKQIHTELSEFRTNGGLREFFRIKVDDATKAIERSVSHCLVKEIYSENYSHLKSENEQHQKKSQELWKTIESLEYKLKFQEDHYSSSIKNLTSENEKMKEALKKYEENHPKISIITKIIEERNHYKEKYNSAVKSLLEYAMDYEKFLLGLGGRYAFWAEEKSKNRPKF